MEHLTDVEIERMLAGESELKMLAHLQSCDLCRADLRQGVTAERTLRYNLYRIICPPTQALFEHAAGYISSATIAAHLAADGDNCRFCQEEVAFYIAWERFPLSASVYPAWPERLNVITARLRAEPGMLPTLRGNYAPVTIYQAENVIVMIDELPCMTVVGQRALHGTVLILEGDGYQYEGGTVELVNERGQIETCSLSTFNSFVFEGIPAGVYRLTLRIPSLCIVIDRLQIE